MSLYLNRISSVDIKFDPTDVLNQIKIEDLVEYYEPKEILKGLEYHLGIQGIIENLGKEEILNEISLENIMEFICFEEKGREFLKEYVKENLK